MSRNFRYIHAFYFRFDWVCVRAVVGVVANVTF